MEPVIERLFGGYPAFPTRKHYASTLSAANITVNEFFFLAGHWLQSCTRSRIISPPTTPTRCATSSIANVNVVAQLVAKRGDRLQPVLQPDITLDLLRKRAAKAARISDSSRQVNEKLPFMPGDGEIAAEDFHAIYWKRRLTSNFPLFAPPNEPIDVAEYAAGFHVGAAGAGRWHAADRHRAGGRCGGACASSCGNTTTRFSAKPSRISTGDRMRPALHEDR